jgi:hypothetical protein
MLKSFRVLDTCDKVQRNMCFEFIYRDCIVFACTNPDIVKVFNKDYKLLIECDSIESAIYSINNKTS